MPKVSINLITWNGAKYIEDCIDAVLNQTFKDYTIILIDNGSSDDTLDIINERFPHLKVIQHKENFGFAKAHNQAIHWTKSDYIVALNQDVILESDFLEIMVDFMDKNEMVGACSPKILRWQDKEKTKYIDTVGLKIFKNYRVVDMGSGEMDEAQYDAIEEIFGVSGAVPFIRRKALEEIRYQNEYFDETFFSYKEDVDLSFRLRLAGWQIWKQPQAMAYHDRTVTTTLDKLTRMQVAKNRKRKSNFANFLSYRNHIYFLIKSLPKLNLSVFLYEMVKFFYVLIFETKNFFKSWQDIFKNKQILILKRKVSWKNAKIKKEELERWF